MPIYKKDSDWENVDTIKIISPTGGLYYECILLT